MARGHGLFWPEKGVAVPPSEESFELELEREAKIAKFVANLFAAVFTGGMFIVWLLLF